VNSSPAALVTRRERWLLATIALAPLALFALVRILGYTGFLKLGALAAVALAGATTAFVRPRWGMWFIVFYVFAGLSYYFPVNVAGILTFVVLAAALLGLMRGGENRLGEPLFLYANALFALIAIGSLLFARDLPAGFREFGVYVKAVILTYLVVQLVRTPDDLRRLMYIIFAGGLATVVLGAINLVFGIRGTGESFVGEGVLRFQSTHANANRAAAFMCMTLPMGLFALKQGNRWLRVPVVVAIIAIIVGIFATFSRSVVFSLSFIIVAVLVHEVRSKRLYVGMVMVLAVAILLAPRMYWQRIVGLQEAFETTTVDWSVYTRLLAMRTAWELSLAHPLTGVGIGNFLASSAYKLFLRIPVHNSYLEILVSTGVFGLLTYVMILLSGVRHSLAGARRRWKRYPEWMRSASFYCALSALSIMISQMFATMPFRHPVWVPVAIGLVIGNLLRQDQVPQDA